MARSAYEKLTDVQAKIDDIECRLAELYDLPGNDMVHEEIHKLAWDTLPILKRDEINLKRTAYNKSLKFKLRGIDLHVRNSFEGCKLA